MLPLLAALLLAPAFAGSLDSKVTMGVVAFDGGQYDRAITALEQALADPSQLKDKNVPRAQLYLGMAYARQAATAGADGAPTALPALAPLAACSLGADRDGDRCREELERAGGQVYNEIAQALSDGDIAGARAKATQAGAALPGHWFGPWMLGMVEFIAGDAHAALGQYDTAWRGVAAKPMPMVVHPVSLLTLRASAIGQLRSVAQGLASLDEGEAVLLSQAGDDERLRQMIEEAVEKGREELRELDGKLRPHRDAAAAPGATAEQLRVWASLQGQLGREAAAEATYKAAVERYPDDAAAWHDLGALYFNRAVGQNDFEVITAAMETARPPLERALALDPTSEETLRALIQVTSVLIDLKAMAAYEEQLDALGAE